MSAPWVKDGEPERWILVPDFARLVKRSRRTVYVWLTARPEILSAFGYSAYRDPQGRWFIKVSKADANSLRSPRN